MKDPISTEVEEEQNCKSNAKFAQKDHFLLFFIKRAEERNEEGDISNNIDDEEDG